jgi:ribosomal protein L29
MGAKQWADDRRELKRHVYGAERFALAHETACATSKARDVARDIAALERIFPIGFGSLAMELRTW